MDVLEVEWRDKIAREINEEDGEPCEPLASRLSRFPLFCLPSYLLEPVEVGLADPPGFRTGLVFKSVFVFLCGKHGAHGLNLFLILIRPPSLYIWEDHNRLRISTSNCRNQSTTPFLPIFPLLCRLSRNLVRFGGILVGGLGWSLDTLHVLLSDGLPRRSSRVYHARHWLNIGLTSP